MADGSSTQALADLFALLAQATDAVSRLHRLRQVRALLVTHHPQLLPHAVQPLLRLTLDASADVRLEVAALIEEALQKSPLDFIAKTNVIYTSLAALAALIGDSTFSVAKKVITCLAIMTPDVFRRLCADVQFAPAWQLIMGVKAIVLKLLDTPTTNGGLRICCIKFCQTLILTLSDVDPQTTSVKDEISLTLIPTGHSVLTQIQLKKEGEELLSKLIQLTATPNAPAALVTVVLHLLYVIVQRRLSLLATVIPHLCNWRSWMSQRYTLVQRNSFERSLKNLVINIIRLPVSTPLMIQMGQVFIQLGAKVNELPRSIRGAIQIVAQVKEQDKRERPLQLDNLTLTELPTKRLRTDAQSEQAQMESAMQERIKVAVAIQEQIDISQLPLHVVVEMVVQSLEAVPQAEVDFAIARQRKELTEVLVENASDLNSKITDAPISQDALNQAEQEDSMIDFDPNSLSAPVSIDYDDDSQPFYLQTTPDPTLDTEQRISAFTRILRSELRFSNDGEAGTKDLGLDKGRQLWMRTVVRMFIRLLTVGEQSDGDTTQLTFIRSIMSDFVCEKFKHRCELALMWIYEEYSLSKENENTTYGNVYCDLLKAVINSSTLEQKDKDFVRLITEAPHLPEPVMDILREYCETSHGYLTVIMALRELVDIRPSLRDAALNMLLSLCTHIRKQIRAIAILAVKSFYPEQRVLTTVIRKASHNALRQLVVHGSDTDGVNNGDSAMADQEGDDTADVKVEPALKEQPANGVIDEKSEAEITRYLDFPFALCAKEHGDIRDVMLVYCDVTPEIQRVMRSHVQNLIRAIGPSSEQLLKEIQEFPEGAETLVLQILRVLTEKTGPSPELVDVVRSMYVSRNVSPKFLLFILTSLDKTEVVTYIPRLMSLLEGTENSKNIVKGIIIRLCDAKGKQAPVISPIELFVQLHMLEESVGLKIALEATQVCFMLPTIFKQEVVIVGIQQLFAQPKLPTLFMRTRIRAQMIQSLSIYKEMLTFIVGMLGRLVTRKIWEQPKLWQGFIRCIQMAQPASFAILFQLPPEQFANVLAKAPDVRRPLREYIDTNGLRAQSRLAPLLALLDTEEEMIQA